MNHTKRCFVLVGALALAAWSTPVLAATVHVAPDGNDAWSGVLARPNAAKTDGPLATLLGARDKIRALKSTNRAAGEKDRVVIAEGNYSVRAPLVLSSQDSGTAYEAAPNAKPVFSGGRVLTGWQAGADGIWSTPIPEVQNGTWNFEQLWVNGRRAPRARTPNDGYFTLTGAVRPENDPASGDKATIAHRTFVAKAEDIASLQNLSPQQMQDVTVVVYHMQQTSRHRIAAMDATSGVVALASRSPWTLYGQRYHLEGIRSALDAPGEWFLDRPSGTLFYKPRLGEEMANARVLAPVADSFIEIKGDAAADKLVTDVSFKGLAFRHGQYVLPPTGHADLQAEVTVPAAIMLDGARRVSFEDCEVSHIGIYAMWFREGCRDNKVTRTLMQDLGAGGVKIGETALRVLAQQTSHITLDNNIISGGGQIHHGAVGVWIGQSGDNAVTHNEIGDFHYTGVSVGWRNAESLARRNKIEFNHIHHIGLGVLSDMGAIYTLGPNEGTTVSNNRIHDVYAHGYGGWGVYVDEGSVGIVLENNLVHDTKAGGFHQHLGTENIVRNNIFAFGKESQLQRSRFDDQLGLTFARNLVYSGGSPIFQGNWYHGIATRSNLYWNAAGNTFNDPTFAQRQAREQDAASIVADPNFVDAKARNFRLKPDSPATKIGFVPFDFSRAGVYGDDAWKKLASTRAGSGVRGVASPPLALDENFETLALAAAPREAVLHLEGKGESIGVSEDAAEDGRRSLKIVDVAGLTLFYNPFLHFEPRHRSGVSRCTFDLKTEAATQMYHEWRDSSTPYKTGPSLRVQDGKLLVGGKALMDMPPNAWVRFHVSAAVGPRAEGTWNLKVTLPGNQERVFSGLKTATLDWENLDWLAFVSDAATANTYFIDNLKLENTP